MSRRPTVIVELKVDNLWKLAEILHMNVLNADTEITRKACQEILEELSLQTDQVHLDPALHIPKSKLDIDQIHRAEALTLVGLNE